MATALLLMAHGSRHAEANADLFYLADRLRESGEFASVEASFLELAEPTIDQAGERCAGSGATRLVLVPYFLSAGVHVRRDLSAARERLARRYPHLTVHLAEPLGRHPLLLEVVAARAREATRAG
jgi:sirohydrochlorin ferrochelatase